MDYRLTEADRAEATLEILPNPLPLPIGRAPRWDDLTEPEKASATKQWLAKHPHATREKAGERSGLTQSQLEYVARTIHDALAEAFPGWVKTCTDAMLEIDNAEFEGKVRKEFRDAINEIKRVDLKILEDRLSAAATRAAAATVAGPTDGAAATLRRELAEVKATAESAQRQLERHSSHLGTLETKVQKLRGGDR